MGNLLKIFFLFLFIINCSADEKLQKNYLVDSKNIFLSDIIQNPKTNTLLFSIRQNKHTKRVKTKNLIKLLETLGYNEFTSRHSYTQFTQKSPINTAKIRKAIQNLYLEKYGTIQISEISVTPRTFMTQMPQEYEVIFNKRAYLSNQATLYIKTAKKRKIFFNYSIKARLQILRARKEIQKGEEISKLNSKNDTITLTKFRAMPLSKLERSIYEAKHKIQEDALITQRDIVGLFLVRRGERVNISVIDANIAVSFSAKANQNGRYGQTITFINSYGKKIKARIVGKKRAEIE